MAFISDAEYHPLLFRFRNGNNEVSLHHALSAPFAAYMDPDVAPRWRVRIITTLMSTFGCLLGLNRTTGYPSQAVGGLQQCLTKTMTASFVTDWIQHIIHNKRPDYCLLSRSEHRLGRLAIPNTTSSIGRAHSYLMPNPSKDQDDGVMDWQRNMERQKTRWLKEKLYPCLRTKCHIRRTSTTNNLIRRLPWWNLPQRGR